MRGRKHLRRLDRILPGLSPVLFFITCCVTQRRGVLASDPVSAVLVSAWRDAEEVHGWAVGRYVVMPDHVHFFASPRGEKAKSLSQFIECWKRWTSPQIRATGVSSFSWQREFFDHLLRGGESYEEKWEYVRANPVRRGLVRSADEWPYQGDVSILRW